MISWKRINRIFVYIVFLFSMIIILGGCAKKAESITLSETDITLRVGDKKTITATVLPADLKEVKIDWSSDNITIAFVNDAGEITAAAVGNAVITAEIDKVKATVNVAVLRSLEEFEVVFDSKGGTQVDNQTVLEGSKVEIPTAPTREGYNFAGWYTNAITTTVYDFEKPVESDLILYAKWDIVKYTITFDTNEGSNISPRSVNHGSRLLTPIIPKRTGYDFSGWYIDEDLTTAYDFDEEVYTNFTLYAKWELTTHNVTFAANGGTAVPSVQVTHGNKIAAPTPPTKTDYVFAGWYTDVSFSTPFDFDNPITSNTTLYAKWDFYVSNYLEVEFELNGGYIPISSSNSFVRAGVMPIQSYEEGISFNGNMFDESIYPTHVYIITFNENPQWWAGVGLKKNNYGLYTATVIQIVGETNANAFKDCDYIITAWSDSGSAYNFVSSIELGQIVAIEGFNESQAYGEVQGGAIHIYESESNYTKVNANLFPENDTLPRPAKPGYRFVGWYETSDFSGSAVTKVTKATKLYAKWELTAYEVTFDANGGSQVPAQTVFGASTITKPVDPVREGYVFKGWYTSKLFANQWDFNNVISWKFTLYALWEEIPE